MKLFGWNERSGTASHAKQRLQTMLADERKISFNHLDELKQEIIILVRRHTRATNVSISTSAETSETFDIKVSINI